MQPHITTNCGTFLKRWEYQTTLPASWEICIQVQKQQLELDMEQQTGSKLRKGYIKEYSLEGLMLKLKLLYFGHLMWRSDSLEKTLMLGRIGGAGGEVDDRGWDGWMASLTQQTWVWVNSGSWWWTGRPVMLQFMGSQRVGHDWVTELNWTELYI